MAEEQESGRGFRVQDRRRFSPDTGEPRTPTTEEKETDQSAPVGQQASSHPQTQQREAPQARNSRPELSFSSFILGLSTQALMHMGEIAAPGEPAATDLPAAQEMIDILTILQQKTTGNLDQTENEMLDTVLFDLRMRYVELTNKGHR